MTAEVSIVPPSALKRLALPRAHDIRRSAFDIPKGASEQCLPRGSTIASCDWLVAVFSPLPLATLNFPSRRSCGAFELLFYYYLSYCFHTHLVMTSQLPVLQKYSVQDST